MLPDDLHAAVTNKAITDHLPTKARAIAPSLAVMAFGAF